MKFRVQWPSATTKYCVVGTASPAATRPCSTRLTSWRNPQARCVDSSLFTTVSFKHIHVHVHTFACTGYVYKICSPLNPCLNAAPHRRDNSGEFCLASNCFTDSISRHFLPLTVVDFTTLCLVSETTSKKGLRVQPPISKSNCGTYAYNLLLIQ